jgi:cyclomaltodextrinase
MTTWPENVMWWHAYPLGFVGATIRPEEPQTEVQHRLDRFEPWLDHLIGLGLNGLLLGPVFASETHGYDTIDHFRIDPRLGDDADFDRLIAAARSRGVRVVLDGVFNHVGRAHPAFRELEQHGASAPTADLFRARWDDAGTLETDVFEGHDALVELDHTSESTVDLVVEVMNFWLARGIDGWRLDAAYAVPPEFWARVLPKVRAEHPDAWFVGEVIHGEASDIVERSGIDSLTQYELWQGVWHSIVDGNLFELNHAIERHVALLGTFAPQTFVGNHDVTRIASAVGPEFVPHALAVLFSVAGIPSVYAGDEFGFLGVKEERLGGDDAVRPEFPAQPPADADLDPAAERILQIHRALIAMRRRHPWLWRAHTDVLETSNTALALRTASGDGAVVALLNIGDDAVSLPVADGATVVVGDAEVRDGHATVPARGFAVLTA